MLSGAEGVYSVKLVARLTGVAPDTLRAWERRYGAIAPTRKESGHRLYSDAEVVRLRLLRQATEAGHAIGRVASLTDEALRGLLAPKPVLAHEPSLVDRVLAAVERYDAVGADAVLSRAAALMPAEALVHEVAAPLLQAVGDRWVAGRIGVAQEHMVSALLRSLLGTMLRLNASLPDRPGILLATPPGERHEMGLLLVGLLAAGRGLPVCYLGADVPVDEIALAATKVGVRVVGISFVRIEDPHEAAAMLKALARSVDPAALWVGGAAAAGLPASAIPAGAIRFGDLGSVERALDALAPTR